MQYFGGKARIAKQLAVYLQPIVDAATAYTEPFVGGANVLVNIQHPRRYASDANPHLMLMWEAVQRGWEPPDSVTEADYAALRAAPPMHPVTAFVGIGCSFAGKWFGGFARASRGSNYVSFAKQSILRKKPGLDGVLLACGDYRQAHFFRGGVAYCDPPYGKTTGYTAVGQFDTEKFWNDMRTLAGYGVRVFVSEYSAPAWAECVLKIPTSTKIRDAAGTPLLRVERLFEVHA